MNHKFQTVIDKNTFYFFNPEFSNEYENYLQSLTETLLVLKSKIETEGLKKEFFEEVLETKENGLRVILALTGFSNEYLKRIITIIRITGDKELDKLVNKDKWDKPEKLETINEWSDKTIENLIKKNQWFRKGIINLFFEGSTVPFLSKTIPTFELKKLSITKLKFESDAMVDTLVRYKEKGSYSGQKENNPEGLIATLLKKLGVTFEVGDLKELIDNVPNSKRTMDFIIPNKQNPKIIIESSFLATTSSGQGDKSKTEISIDTLLKQHYPNSQFIGFVDGIGWYVRRGDLQRMVSAYSDVFTYNPDELLRFEKLLIKTFDL